MAAKYNNYSLFLYFRRNGVMHTGQDRNDKTNNDHHNTHYDISRDVNESQGSGTQTVQNSNDAVPQSNINNQTMTQSFSSRLLQVV